METTAEQKQEQLESDRAVSQRQEEERQKKPQQEDKDNQMGVMFFSILLLLCVVGDLIDFFTVGTIGWVIGLFIDAVLLIAGGLNKAGRKQFKKIVVGAIGDSIPILNILPFRSFFLIWSFVNSRYQLPTQLGLSGLKQTKLGE